MNESDMPDLDDEDLPWDPPPDDYDEQPPETQMETNALAEALSKAQGEFSPILRNKTVSVTMRSGGKYVFSYAPLESILHAVTPALSKNGLSLTQATSFNDAGKEFVETTLRHSSGQSIRNLIPIFVKDEGPQAYGSALTYARRYGVTLLLCISADDDDDANAAEGNSATDMRADPRGEDWKKEDPKVVKGYADRFLKALGEASDPAIYKVHLEVAQNPDLYIAISNMLGSKERAAIKLAVGRMKEGAPVANGKAAAAHA